MDWTVSYRPGSRFGPNKIREVSIGLEEYSPYLDRELHEVKFFDAGDIPLPFGNPEKSLLEIETYVHTLLKDNKIPMGMGGEHLVSLPVMKAVASKYDDLAIIHFDAHTDLRENYEGEEYSHSTPIRKIADHIGPKNVYSFGIRSGMKEEFEWAKEQGMHLYKFEVLEPLKQVLPTLEGRPVYITIDMDVLEEPVAEHTLHGFSEELLRGRRRKNHAPLLVVMRDHVVHMFCQHPVQASNTPASRQGLTRGL